MLAAPTDPSTAVRPDPRDARTTGLLYLAVAVTGVLSFLVIRARIFEEDGPAATLANLLEHETLARAGIGLGAGFIDARPAGVVLTSRRLLPDTGR